MRHLGQSRPREFSEFFFARIIGALPRVKADGRFSDGKYFAGARYLPRVTVRARTLVLHAYFKLIVTCSVGHGCPRCTCLTFTSAVTSKMSLPRSAAWQ